jgi:hypothetical protein
MYSHPQRSADDILADISASVAEGVQRGALPPDERFHREYIAIIQRALGQSQYSQPRTDTSMEPADYFSQPLSDPEAPEEEETNREQSQACPEPSTMPAGQNVTPPSVAGYDDIDSSIPSQHRSTPLTASASDPSKRWSTGSYPSDNSMSTAQSSAQSMVVQTPIDPPIDPYPEVIEIPISQDLGWGEIRNVDLLLEDFLDDSFFDSSTKVNQQQ